MNVELLEPLTDGWMPPRVSRPGRSEREFATEEVVVRRYADEARTVLIETKVMRETAKGWEAIGGANG